MSPRNESQRVKDIIEAITHIYEVRKLLFLYPHNDTLPAIAYQATSYNLIIIGEAVKHLSPEFREKHSSIDWHRLIQLRNFLAHQYHEVQVDAIDTLITESLEKVADYLEKLDI